MSDRDPFEILRDHLRAQTGAPTPTDDELAALIISGEIAAPSATDLQPRRRRRRTIGIIVTGVLIGTGGVAAALLARSEHVRRPNEGVACRDTLGLTGSAVVLAPTDDPVGACAAVWQRGELPANTQPGTPVGTVPPLIACVAPNGSLNVLPAARGETCADLALAAPDGASVTADQVTQLQDRLSSEISTQCVSPPDARARIVRILAEMHLAGWTLVLNDDQRGPCTGTGVDGVLRIVYVGSVRPPNPTP